MCNLILITFLVPFPIRKRNAFFRNYFTTFVYSYHRIDIKLSAIEPKPTEKMGSIVRKIAFETLGIKNYLRLVQKGFFWSYNLGLLKNNKTYEYHYFAAKLIEKGDTVVDIGANLGYFSKLFSKWVGSQGRVYAVEPIALYNEIFKKETAKCKNITLLPYALGAEEKEIELVTSPKTSYLKTGLPHVYDKKRDGELEDHKFRFRAKMTIADKLFKDIDKIDYLKCDVEGFEFEVLQNMKETIERCKPTIQIELWGQNEADVIAFLSTYGYTPYKLKTTEKGQFLNNSIDTIKQSGDHIFIHANNKRYDTLIEAENYFES